MTGQPFRKDGFRPRRFNDRDGNEGQDAWKRPVPLPASMTSRRVRPAVISAVHRDGFANPPSRQDA